MPFRWIVSLIVALFVMLATANLLGNGGEGFMEVPPYVYYAVATAALAVPLFWALSHVLMGIIMGVSGGGLKEGLKLGLVLGIGMALGRSWPNVAAVGAGLAIVQAPVLWVGGLMVAAAVLFALDRVLAWFWTQHKPR